ncbi:MAG: tetratricopeptide repeat protein [Clostridia bacterium]|nr:tetratricopeptide repeat protein [Clostridia bacterium]
MTVLVGFVIIVMAVLLIYMAYRMLLRRSLIVLFSFCFQLIALTASIMGFVSNVQTSNAVEAAYIIFGVVVPALFFIYDYARMMKKIREQGVYQGFVESVDRQDGKKKDIDMNGRNICPNIKERQVPELIKDLNLNKDDILKNLKKSLTQAQAYIQNRDYENAFEIYNTLIKLIKNCASLYYNHANICYELGAYSDALLSYRKVLELNEKNIKEIASPQEVLQIDKKDSGRNALGLSQSEADIKYQEFTVHYNMGNTLFKLNRYEQAIESYRKALEINPNLEYACENTARAFIAMGKKIEALEYYRRIVENDIGNPNAHYILGKLLGELNIFDEAAAELKECTRLNANFHEANEELGKLLSKAGRYEEAEAYFRIVVKNKPKSYKAHYNLGAALYKLNKPEQAVECFRTAIELEPESYKSYYNLAMALDELGRQDEAAKAFKRVIELKDDFIDAYNNLGIMLSTQGKHLEALNVYVKGLKKNPEEYSLYFNMGITLSDMGRYPEAVEAYKNAIEIKPDEYEIHYHMGAALMEMKRYSEAAEAYKTALKVKPSDSELFYNLSIVYSLLKKNDIAIDNLKKAVQLNTELKREAKYNSAFDSIRSSMEFKELIS